MAGGRKRFRAAASGQRATPAPPPSAAGDPLACRESRATLARTLRRRTFGLSVLVLAGAHVPALVAGAPAWAQERPAGENRVVLHPSQDYEVCLEMTRSQTITYSYQASQPLDFNIHYHQDETVLFPVKNSGFLGLSDSFIAPASQTYCLMWTNPQAVKATLSIRLEGP
jgi:hypothetical protein